MKVLLRLCVRLRTTRYHLATQRNSSAARVPLGIGYEALTAMRSGWQRKWGNFIAQWVPTWLIFGLYNKLVKLEGQQRRRDEDWQRIAAKEANPGLSAG